ncbi:streptomycin adenylyltransferase [Thermosporothrix hazakensis]|jgi:hypothetical protein|uniref:Streptomycin adenylyltransferase n=2 Tax=Thermosporothrix TaxID=768650 RepID=A0A326U9D6_THEHA|nr:aminoglycoside 6-adenylyltransferase [Thermosporothrix hazakensis]PZW31137.1 streptomycin adenylyltransferase [Thermosporothrix hazakensis]BBH86641.1 hypothetical protein KTC_13920 [Thermosporothrix sp. COM3]GCE50951.1 hypothetical protein KTH_58200 [Thermosporothrix hazakensis]
MGKTTARQALQAQLLDMCRQDKRIAGLVDYSAEDERILESRTDFALTLFIIDTYFDTFVLELEAWFTRFGPPLLLLREAENTIRVVYDAQPLPVHLTAICLPANSMHLTLDRPALEANVLYDATGQLTTALHQAADAFPTDQQATFEELASTFWYDLLDTLCKLLRGDQWNACQLFHVSVLPALIRLLRLEATIISQWYNHHSGIEPALPAERLARLNACLPTAATLAGTARALRKSIELGSEVCRSIAALHGFRWPHALAERIEAIVLFWLPSDRCT